MVGRCQTFNGEIMSEMKQFKAGDELIHIEYNDFIEVLEIIRKAPKKRYILEEDTGWGDTIPFFRNFDGPVFVRPMNTEGREIINLNSVFLLSGFNKEIFDENIR